MLFSPDSQDSVVQPMAPKKKNQRKKSIAVTGQVCLEVRRMDVDSTRVNTPGEPLD